MSQTLIMAAHDVRDLCEELTRRAVRGELQAIAVVTVDRSGNVSIAVKGTAPQPVMIAGTQHLMNRLCDGRRE